MYALNLLNVMLNSYGFSLQDYIYVHGTYEKLLSLNWVS